MDRVRKGLSEMIFDLKKVKGQDRAGIWKENNACREDSRGYQCTAYAKTLRMYVHLLCSRKNKKDQVQ